MPGPLVWAVHQHDHPAISRRNPLSASAGSQPRRADGPYAELLPWLLEQVADWEVAATANVVGETPLVRVSGAWLGCRAVACVLLFCGHLWLSGTKLLPGC